MNLPKLFNHSLFTEVVGGLLVVAITAITTVLITSYVYKPSNDIPKIRTVETVNIKDLEQALGAAKEKVEATGYIVSKLTPDDISEKLSLHPKFTVSLVVVNPFSPVLCQRQRDEDRQPRNYQQILSKLREFRQKSKSMIGGRLRLGVSDVYPTMTVIIVDDDLFAYFYPYKGLGTTSPVLKFTDYVKDERAKFFETHLRNVFLNAKFLTSDADYKRYETANLNDPCFP